jgi:hypothetical protein
MLKEDFIFDNPNEWHSGANQKCSHDKADGHGDHV